MIRSKKSVKNVFTQRGQVITSMRGGKEKAINIEELATVILPPAGVETDPAFSAWLSGPPNISIFTNDAGYLTAESDPAFSAWLADFLPVSLEDGGTNAALTAAEGGLVYSTDSALAISDPDDIQWDNAGKRLNIGWPDTDFRAHRLGIYGADSSSLYPFVFVGNDKTAATPNASLFIVEATFAHTSGEWVAFTSFANNEAQSGSATVLGMASIVANAPNSLTAVADKLKGWSLNVENWNPNVRVAVGIGAEVSFFSHPAFATGGFTNAIAYSVRADFAIAGVNEHFYAYYLPDFTWSPDQWGLYTLGTTKSFIGGQLLIGDATIGSALGRLVLKTGTTEADGISFGTDEDAKRPRIFRSGDAMLAIMGANVGIGTTSPTLYGTVPQTVAFQLNGGISVGKNSYVDVNSDALIQLSGAGFLSANTYSWYPMFGCNLAVKNDSGDVFYTPITTPSYGYRAIRFGYSDNIDFIASAGATTAGGAVTPPLLMRIQNDGTVTIYNTLVLSGNELNVGSSSFGTSGVRVKSGSPDWISAFYLWHPNSDVAVFSANGETGEIKIGSLSAGYFLKLYSYNAEVLGFGASGLATFAGDINLASGKVYKVNAEQVIGARVVNAGIDDAIEAAFTALYPNASAVLGALQAGIQAHGLVTAS